MSVLSAGPLFITEEARSDGDVPQWDATEGVFRPGAGGGGAVSRLVVDPTVPIQGAAMFDAPSGTGVTTLPDDWVFVGTWNMVDIGGGYYQAQSTGIATASVTVDLVEGVRYLLQKSWSIGAPGVLDVTLPDGTSYTIDSNDDPDHESNAYYFVASASGPGTLSLTNENGPVSGATGRLYLESASGPITLTPITEGDAVEIVNVGGVVQTEIRANRSDIFIGYHAGQYVALDNTTGESNVIIGDESGTGLANITQSVVIGYGAVRAADQSNDSVGYSVFVGAGSGYLVESGDENTCIGAGAGSSIVAGDQNTALGVFAGGDGEPDSDTSRTICIGYAAGWDNADDDVLIIDVNDEFDSARPPLIGGNFDTRIVSLVDERMTVVKSAPEYGGVDLNLYSGELLLVNLFGYEHWNGAGGAAGTAFTLVSPTTQAYMQAAEAADGGALLAFKAATGQTTDLLKLLSKDGDYIVQVAGDSKIGFFAHAPVARPTGVAVSAPGIHAALVSLGLITA